ncbi:MAG TPA: phage portal protein [Sphingomonas sp.]|uniref:phage portal protein n=1 Tax=Sphingomonas sp. TaxID=28214 RepID=UPI002EDB5DD5
MNWIDRAVGFVDPTAGLRRQAARKALERSAPPRAATRANRRSDRDWNINTGNPNDARPGRFVSRQTVLKLVAENPFAKKAMNALLNSVVGWGIKGVPSGSKSLKAAWAEWIKVCDFNGRLDLYGLQELWARCMFRDGDTFIVKRLVAGASGIPIRLQSFDKAMLAVSKIGEGISSGIEYDGDGRVTAYHFYRTRPGQRWWTGETVRFPADEVIHLYHAEFFGQTEGVSIFESVVKRLGDVDEGIEAEVVKANISACLVGFRYRKPNANPDEDESIGMPVDHGSDRPPVEELVPGVVETLDPGEEIVFSNPPRSSGIADLARIALLASAAGIGTTYEQMTGDLSNVNFSSYKAGRLEFNRTVGRVQYLTFIPIALDPIWGWFYGFGSSTGQFPKKNVPITWTPPPIESIDRMGDAEADVLEMEAGLESRGNLIAGRGYDEDELIEQIAASRAKSQAKSLTFKGDIVEGSTDTGAAVPNDRAAEIMLGRAMMRMIRRARADA